ncbi:hypothetical protein, partial [Halapricum sp. CBA1109]|uniref:hypothetical protein n=1 Tax=Halapricum sp. CBA1109 TaxID=2668068 RepID=UPI001E62B9D9
QRQSRTCWDSLGSADDASSFRAVLTRYSCRVRRCSDYFDGSDVLPKRAKGRIVDVVGDSDSLSGADAADARDALRNLDDVSHREISTFIDDGETGGVGFLSEVDQSTVDNVFSFDVGGGSTDIAVRTRAGIAQAYNRNHFSTSEWAGDVYPDATDAEGVVNKIADDINALSGRDDVVGLARTLGKGSDGGTGSYFVDLPSPAASSNPVKGVSLEIRAAATEATDLGDNVLRLSYEPEVDFTELSDSAVQDIADKISDDTSTVENALIDGDSSRDVELDAFRDSESGTDIYFEPKNRDSVSSATVRDQIIRYFGVQKSEGIGLENSDVTVYVRSESQASDLEGAFDSSWFTVKTPSDE